MFPGELNGSFSTSEVLTGMEKRNTPAIETGVWTGDGVSDMTKQNLHSWSEDE